MFTFPSSATNTATHINKYFSFHFLDFMLSIFGDSQRTLHDTFMQTYGHLYEKNSDLFEDFFKELRRYYERGNDNLFEITNKLFSKLYQRMFQVSFILSSSQYFIDNNEFAIFLYLTKISKNIK